MIEIPNGINVEEFEVPYSKEDARRVLGLRPDSKVVLYLSALYELKGPHILLKAIPKVVEHHRDAFFVFVGGGDVEKYRKMARDLGIEKYTRFTGYIEESAKLLYYKAADIFVLPSIEKFESFGLVNLEAMASGLPVVASKIGGVPDVIGDDSGILVPPRNPNALAEAIIYLLDNESERKKMGENARLRARKYSWNEIARMYESVYEKLVMSI